MKDKQTEDLMEEYGKNILLIAAVAESSEYQYDEDAFEAAYPKMRQERLVETKGSDCTEDREGYVMLMNDKEKRYGVIS